MDRRGPLSFAELSAVARLVIQQHGERAQEAIAEKIAYLALLEDTEGVEVWEAVAARIEYLSPAFDDRNGPEPDDGGGSIH